MPMLHEQHGHIKEFYNGDPYENRTRVTAVKGPCLNRLTNGPWSTQGKKCARLAECCQDSSVAWLVAVTGFEPVTLRV